jgi:hypothetical protein
VNVSFDSAVKVIILACNLNLRLQQQLEYLCFVTVCFLIDIEKTKLCSLEIR